MDLEKIIKDFNALKRRSVEISVENRKLVSEEAKILASARKPRVYRLNEPEDSPASDEDVSQRFKLMNYTIQQYEDWAERQREKNVKKAGGDMKDLAKYTYEKELKSLRNGGKIQKHITKATKSPITGKLAIQDDSQLVNRLARDINKTAKERYNARRKEMEKMEMQSVKGGFINEKNKQFNEKLDRQLGMEEED